MSVIALAISGSNLCGNAPFSCCLRSNDELRAASSPAGQRGDIAQLARDLLTESGVAPGDLRELRIDLGPGSYTGLRVAITFARFLQHFGDLTVLAGDSLALLASDAPSKPGARLRPLLDARRGKFHCATLIEENGSLRHLEEARAMPFDDVLDSTRKGDTFVVPATLGEEPLVALQQVGATIHTTTSITAERLFSGRIPLLPCTSQQLEPRYLMGTYAQQEAQRPTQ